MPTGQNKVQESCAIAKDYRAMRLTAQSDNTHMVCCQQHHAHAEDGGVSSADE